MNAIVSNVEMADAILENVVSQFKLRIGLGNDVRSEAAAARGSAEQSYPELWHRLDAAREAAKRAGLDVSRYDTLRPARLELDDAGVQAAREAITVFRAAGPQLPWSAPTSGSVANVRNGTGIATLIIRRLRPRRAARAPDRSRACSRSHRFPRRPSPGTA